MPTPRAHATPERLSSLPVPVCFAAPVGKAPAGKAPAGKAGATDRRAQFMAYSMSTAALGEPPIRSPASEFWRRFRGKRVALISLGMILMLAFAAALAPWIAPFLLGPGIVNVI